MQQRKLVALWLVLAVVVMLFAWSIRTPATLARAGDEQPSAAGPGPHRSPVDLLLLPDQQHVVTANESSHSLSLVDLAAGRVVDEVPCGEHPAALVLAPGVETLWASSMYDGYARRFAIIDGKLRETAKIFVGMHPRGLAISPDGKLLYVAQSAAAQIAVIDLQKLAVADHIEVGNWPMGVAISPDGNTLAVACNGDRTVAVVDLVKREQQYAEPYTGINGGQMQVSADGKFVYMPWMVYRHNPITKRNIQLGWVLASRIGRLKLDGAARRQAISLDPPGKAISDPHGLALTSDEEWLVATGSGTHELLIYHMPDLNFMDYGGPGDHIERSLLNNPQRFDRVILGGRPMNVRLSADDARAYVVNYLRDSVQTVDLATRQVLSEIHLGGPTEPDLVRQGEIIFYDGSRSLDQWYSCHSCHYEGGTNSQTMDTMNDGTIRTFKTVLPLYGVTKTPPWTWHGWQKDLDAAMHKSMTETMLGPLPSPEDREALVAYFEQLESPPNPNLTPDGQLTPEAIRGEKIFQSAKAGCSNCHRGARFTDGEIHDVGLGSDKDAYQGFNTPSLIGVYRKVLLLHHGRGKSLEQALTEFHNPRDVTGLGELSEEELADLLAYVRSL